MMKAFLVASLICVTLAGCVVEHADIKYPAGAILPFEAIQRAAYAAPNPVYGVFWLRVQATGTAHGEVYLNSEKDYRDQRNITIVIRPSVVKALEEKLGPNPAATLMHKSILVRGAARRVTIHFGVNGRPSTKYYYQTHINVTDTGQISFDGRG